VMSPPGGLQRSLQISGGIVVRGLQPERGPEFSNRFIDLLLADQCKPEEIVCCGIGGRETYALPCVRPRIVENRLLHVFKGKVPLREAVARIDGHGVRKGVERILVVPERGKRVAEIAPSVRVSRVIAEVDPQFVGCFGVLSEGQQLEAKNISKLRQVLDGGP